MPFDGVTWNESLPDNNTLAHEIDDYERDLRIGVRSRMSREHVWPSSQTGTNEGGHHNFITLQQQTSAPVLSTASGLTQVGALYVGSSAAGYPLVFENSAGSLRTLVNSAGNTPIVTSGTLGSIPICSSANPDSLTLLAGPTSTTATNWILVSSNNATGGVQAPIWVKQINLVPSLGAWSSKSNNTVYTAASDGFVMAQRENISADLVGYTDSNNPPTTQVAIEGLNSSPENDTKHYASIMFPVRSGQYWKVTGATTVYWVPLSV